MKFTGEVQSSAMLLSARSDGNTTGSTEAGPRDKVGGTSFAMWETLIGAYVRLGTRQPGNRAQRL